MKPLEQIDPELSALIAEHIAARSGRMINDKTPAGKGKIRRNDPCPCGSTEKYKHCCLNK